MKRSTRSSSGRSPLATLCALLVVAVAMALAPRAHAQPDKSPNPAELDDEAKLELAKKHFTEALGHHEAGRYSEAAHGYLTAYDLFPRPLFLYNAAIVYRLGGEKEKSLEHYKKYLELEPTGKGADSAAKFVAILEKELAAQKAADQSGGSGDGGAKDPSGSGDQSGDGQSGDGQTGDGANGASGDGASGAGDSSKDLDGSTALPVVTRESIERRGSGKRLTGLITSGIGVALIAGGIGFGAHARSLSDQASEFQGPAGEELDDLYSRGDAADRNMVILLSAGALTTVAGGLVYYLGVRDRARAERNLQFFFSPTTTGAGAGVSGRF